MITFITGGSGSGKTSLALKLASSYSKKIYIATAEHTDVEMTEKINLHKQERDKTYETVEEPVYLSKALQNADKKSDIIIIDCITFWTNNLIYYKKDIFEQFNLFLSSLKNSTQNVIIVSNEISLCIIPAEKTTRNYVKYLTFINKKIAEISDKVILMISGIPVEIKKRGAL